MASTAQPAAAAPLRRGVPPLQAGVGHSLFWRRLHSLTGIVPIGAFLVEHILYSNAVAMNGPRAYAEQVKFLGSLPLVLFLEAFGIWLPIAYHAVYGFYIWYRGESNVAAYPWQGNWMYTAQRWTGAIVFFYIAWHVWHLRFDGVDLHAFPGASFGKVQNELFVAWQFIFYVVGLVCAAWHFSYGIWLFCAKWGIATGEAGRKKLLAACIVLFFVISGVGLASITKFRSTPQQPFGEQDSQQIYPATDTPPVTH